MSHGDHVFGCRRTGSLPPLDRNETVLTFARSRNISPSLSTLIAIVDSCVLHPTDLKTHDPYLRRTSMANPTPRQAEPTQAEPVDDKRWLGLAVIAIAQLMVVLDASIVNIALPSARDLASPMPTANGRHCVHARVRRTVAAWWTYC